jgi:electron transport complex protein RnfG
MDNSLVKLVITLTIIGIVSALALAFVFEWTTPYIEKHKAKAQEEAVFEVIPNADKYKEVTKNDQTFFEGYSESGNRVGTALIVSGPGFQGMIKLMVGIDLNDKKINGIRILEHQETPGLGAKITDEEYKGNFKGKPFSEDYNVIKRETSDPYKVKAIAGATISSQKVTNIVEGAVQEFETAYGGGN